MLFGCVLYFEYSASGYYGHYCPLPGFTQSFLVLVCTLLSLMFLLSIFACSISSVVCNSL